MRRIQTQRAWSWRSRPPATKQRSRSCAARTLLASEVASQIAMHRGLSAALCRKSPRAIICARSNRVRQRCARLRPSSSFRADRCLCRHARARAGDFADDRHVRGEGSRRRHRQAVPCDQSSRRAPAFAIFRRPGGVQAGRRAWSSAADTRCSSISTRSGAIGCSGRRRTTPPAKHSTKSASCSACRIPADRMSIDLARRG